MIDLFLGIWYSWKKSMHFFIFVWDEGDDKDLVWIEGNIVVNWGKTRFHSTVFWCVQFTYQYSACVQCYYLIQVAVDQWVKVALKSPPNTILGRWSLCAGETAPQSERHPPALNGTARPEPHARKLTPGSLPPEVSSSCIVLLIQRPNQWGHWISG